jgi:hypothetical protein
MGWQGNLPHKYLLVPKQKTNERVTAYQSSRDDFMGIIVLVLHCNIDLPFIMEWFNFSL